MSGFVARNRLILLAYAGVAVLLLITALFSPGFLAPSNLRSTLVLAAFVGIVAFGQTARPAGFARYAPLVFESADRGDAVAMSVVASAVADVNAALGAIVWDGCRRLCLTGGLAENYQHRLAERFRHMLQPARGNALTGAVELAVETFVTP